MKKLLLATTAIAGAVLVSAPASAAVKLDLGGFFRGYGVWADNNEPAAASLHGFEFRRDTEVHVGGETTLDNGLTVGFHTEQKLGGATATDEAYAYFSSGMGRINLGSEDGAGYLLQVAAPSADSNVDGLRQYINGVVAQDVIFTTGAATLGLSPNATLDYDMVSDPTQLSTTGASERITYLSPKFNGFQAGASYAPTQGQQGAYGGVAGLTGDLSTTQYQDIWEVGARWDGEFQGFGISAGAGYADSELEVTPTKSVPGGGTEDTAPTISDAPSQWNAGASVSFSGFTLGGSFLRQQSEMDDVVEIVAASTNRVNKSMDVTKDSWVAGLAYDNGPYHVGTSYLRQKIERDASGTIGVDDGVSVKLNAVATRFTVGGGYTFGPGMTFRGGVAWGKFDNKTGAADGAQAGSFTATGDNRYTQVTVGTDIQF